MTNKWQVGMSAIWQRKLFTRYKRDILFFWLFRGKIDWSWKPQDHKLISPWQTRTFKPCVRTERGEHLGPWLMRTLLKEEPNLNTICSLLWWLISFCYKAGCFLKFTFSFRHWYIKTDDTLVGCALFNLIDIKIAKDIYLQMWNVFARWV